MQAATGKVASSTCVPRGRDWTLEVIVRRIASVAAGLLVICALAAPAVASPEFVAPAKAQRGPIATQANAGASVALALLQRLGNYTANRNAGNGFGQFLMQLGYGDADAARLDAIDSTLRDIKGELKGLNDKVDAVNEKVNNGNCNDRRENAALVRSQTEEAWGRIGSTVNKAWKELRNPAEQEELSRTLVDQIKDEFKTTTPGGAVRHIHDSLVGTAGSPNMIDVCGVAYQEANGDFITSTIRGRVVSLVDY
jgi:hypothetical protein